MNFIALKKLVGDRGSLPILVGQQMDVYIDAGATTPHAHNVTNIVNQPVNVIKN